MRRLAARLGLIIPEQIWPALAEAATFERMRQRSDDLAPDVPLGIVNDSREFFRSGSSGQWRQWLTDEDPARCPGTGHTRGPLPRPAAGGRRFNLMNRVVEGLGITAGEDYFPGLCPSARRGRVRSLDAAS